MTAPPPPAPITMTSRIGLPPAPEVAAELVATIGDPGIVAEVPADRPVRDGARHWIEHRRLGKRQEADDERQHADEPGRTGIAFERGEHECLLCERQVRERRAERTGHAG